MTEFWPELLTVASWKKLQDLKKELKNFTVIGGWAIYLWTGLHKSKDIDIIVDFGTLSDLKQKYELNKNPALKKYEVKQEKFDIDVYVPHFSEFVIPMDELARRTVIVRGFKTLEPEAILVLKQAAELQRKNSIKGEKDAIDILTLLANVPFKMPEYFKLLKKYDLSFYAGELARIIRDFDAKNSESIGLSFKDFQKWRKVMLKELQQPSVEF